MITAQIAGKLFTSPRTLETHRQNIMEKTRAKNTAALVKTAFSQGWLT
ncbi:LuxR C-terminal-related transcriptional regulator [Hymenobacter norwichensis]|nr:LuxR C-terminal-related transcriptional regulator [Hymenobacter norwichensis]